MGKMNKTLLTLALLTACVPKVEPVAMVEEPAPRSPMYSSNDWNEMQQTFEWDMSKGIPDKHRDLADRYFYISDTVGGEYPVTRTIGYMYANIAEAFSAIALEQEPNIDVHFLMSSFIKSQIEKSDYLPNGINCNNLASYSDSIAFVFNPLFADEDGEVLFDCRYERVQVRGSLIYKPNDDCQTLESIRYYDGELFLGRLVELYTLSKLYGGCDTECEDMAMAYSNEARLLSDSYAELVRLRLEYVDAHGHDMEEANRIFDIARELRGIE